MDGRASCYLIPELAERNERFLKSGVAELYEW